MDYMRPYLRPGVTTGEIDRLVYGYTMEHGHTPACLGYQGYSKSVCTSINEVVCHGIPGDRRLKEGDIVNVDLTTVVEGWYGDSSETFLIGEVSDEARRLVQVTFDAMWAGIHGIKPNGRVIDVGQAIYQYARPHGFEVVREYQGHGIGREFHQEPGVPHYPTPKSRRDIVKPGVCFTIEPMLNQGVWRTVKDKADLRARLRFVGLSKSAAERVASVGWPALSPQNAAADAVDRICAAEAKLRST